MNADLLQGFYLGDVLVEPLTGKVTSRAGVAHLSPNASEVLLCLASSPGELVTRATLINEGWGEGGGSDELLDRAIGEIRNALHDEVDNPTYVQTLPQHGYRLIIMPESVAESTSSVVIGATDGARVGDIGFFENLKQRGVLETAVAYLIVGWLLIQVADIVFDQLHVPDWAGTFVTLLVIAGFPIALALSWFIEVRQGNAVLDNLTAAGRRRRRFSRTYMSVVGALAAAAVLVFLYDRSIGLPEPEGLESEVMQVSFAPPPVTKNSIAVLPFLNIDGGEDTHVFASGLVDDVLTRLAQVRGLRVSSRGDSFSLQPNSPSNVVRRRLRVAHYLEGSVQMSDNRLRIIVQLIDSSNGFHIMSRSYDRKLEDFFDIRDEITDLTVANVRASLPDEPVQPLVVAGETTAPNKEGLDEPLQSTEPEPLDAYVLYRKGVDASRLPITAGTVSQAVDWFDAALEIDPEYAAAYAGKCAIYAEAYDELNDPALISFAESACAKAVNLNPNLISAHTALGRLFTATGRLSEAEREYRTAVEINQTSIDALTGLGRVYRLQDKPDHAERVLREATGLQPGDWRSYNALGTFLYTNGRYTEAAQQYGYVVAIDPDNAVGYSNLGTAYMLAGDFTTAASVFTKAVSIQPLRESYSNLGLMHYYLGNYETAIDAHRKATELSPDDHLTWSNLGDAYSAGGYDDDAQEAWERALQLASGVYEVNPNSPETLMDLAWLNVVLGNEREARDLMDRALEMAPGDPYSHYYDALLLHLSGERDAAFAALQRALDAGFPMRFLSAEPVLDPLKTDPRFTDLLNDS